MLLINVEVFAQTLEYQGAKIRILNKDTTEKSFYDLPLSQTLEINNSQSPSLKLLREHFICILI